MILPNNMQVVCINDDLPPLECVASLPKKDCIYTVRGYSKHSAPAADEFIGMLLFMASIPQEGLLLCELVNPACPCGDGTERGFPPHYFVPLLKKKQDTDITVFTDILKETTAPVAPKVPEPV